jgi:hypothetical protein
MSKKIASIALSRRLSVMPNLPTVAPENTEFTPVSGEMYIEEQTVFTGSNEYTLKGSQQLNFGIYRLYVYADKGSSKFNSLDLLDDLSSHFAKGTVLDEQGQKLEIYKVHPLSSYVTDAWYVTPLMVYFRFYA